MTITTVFDDLADLVLIEILSYLSCTDTLCVFTCLNDRFTKLLVERGFFRHVNLSSTYHRQFNKLLHVLPLNDLETLVIDRNTSPLQLIQWPYLPHLTKLYLRGVREYDSILIFVLLHAATLTHLTIESDKYSLTDGLSEKFHHTVHHLYSLVKNILLRYLPILRSLDLGFDSSHFILDWNIIHVQVPLTYLRVTLDNVNNLLCIMATRPLSSTLRELHVKIRDRLNRRFRLSDINICMSSLRTFTFVKPLYHQFADEWKFIDMLTSCHVMPILQRVNLIVAITIDDLNQIDKSMLFNDDRLVDIHYAFILNDNLSHIELNKRIPCGSRSRPRSVASGTFVRDTSNSHLPTLLPGIFYIPESQERYHLWYTLPWVFNEFCQLSIPDQYITQLQVSAPSLSTTMISPSRLLRINLIRNVMSPAVILPHILSTNCIEELNLFCCDRNISLKLPSLHRINLINSHDALHSCFSISRNIRSITIVLHQYLIPYTTGNWADLRTLCTLPLLRSLRIIMYDIHKCPNDASCQIIAETTVLLVDFAFTFRKVQGFLGLNPKSIFIMYRSFIEQLRQRIIATSLDHKPYYKIEQDGLGLMIWR